MIRLGLIGVGPWANRYAETVRLLIDPPASIVAYARQKAEDVPWLPYAKRVTPDEIFDPNLHVEALIVACEPVAATRYAIKALELGIPAIVEKPVTTSTRAAFEIMAKATVSRSWVRVGYTHLHAPAYQALCVALVHECQKKGDSIAKIESSGAGPGPQRSYSSLWDYGPHDAAMLFDLVELTGELSSFRLNKVERDLTADGGQKWLVEALVGNNILASISVSNASATKVRQLTVTTKKGRVLTYDDRRAAGAKFIIDGKPQQIMDRGPLTCMLESFTTWIHPSAIRNSPPPDHLRDLHLTTKVTEFLACVQRAIESQDLEEGPPQP